MQLSAQTRQLADRIADSIARGRPVPNLPAFERFLSGSIEEVFAVLDAFERHVGGSTERTEDLAEAYLHLLELRMQFLRFEIDAGHEWAKEAARRFQLTVAQHAREGRLNNVGLAAIGRALREAKLAPIPELIEAGVAQVEAAARDGAVGELPREIERMVVDLIAGADGNPYAIHEAMAEAGFTLPAETLAPLAAMFLDRPERAAQEAAALAILDPNADSRRAVALALLSRAARLSPVSLRRLIMVRNWLPEAEHHLVDQVVRAAREAGVQCATHAPGAASELHASAPDGSGALGFAIMTPEGRKWRASMLVFKRKTGVQDAWRTDPASKGALMRKLRLGDMRGMMNPVGPAYLHLAARHHLALGRAAGNAPPAGFLEIAEAVGGYDWQPAELDWRDALTALVAEIPAKEKTRAEVARVLAESAAWSDVATRDSWFEEGPELTDLLARARTRDPERLAEYVLRTFVAQRTAKWAEHFAWVALWLRHAQPAARDGWREFALLANAVADGRDVAEIPIMFEIAARSAYVAVGPSAA